MQTTFTGISSRKSKKVRDSSPEPTVTFRRWEEEEVDCCDPDKLFLCPYDPNHKIRACRFPYHLIKCKKNNHQLASQLWTCPFNARHLMPKHELSQHMTTCINKSYINDDSVSGETQRKFQVPISTWTIPVSDEDWDQEEDQSGTPEIPFVWGVSTSLNQGGAEPAVTHCLTPTLRAPRVLPWKLGM